MSRMMCFSIAEVWCVSINHVEEECDSAGDLPNRASRAAVRLACGPRRILL